MNAACASTNPRCTDGPNDQSVEKGDDRERDEKDQRQIHPMHVYGPVVGVVSKERSGVAGLAIRLEFPKSDGVVGDCKSANTENGFPGAAQGAESASQEWSTNGDVSFERSENESPLSYGDSLTITKDNLHEHKHPSRRRLGHGRNRIKVD